MKTKVLRLSGIAWFANLLMLGFVATLLSLRTAQADIIVASNVPATFQYSAFFTSVGYAHDTNGGFANTAVSQRFVSTHSGALSKLLVFVGEQVGAVPLKVSIRSDLAGFPGTTIAEKTFAASELPPTYYPPGSPTLLDMASLGVILNAGTTYHAVFRTDSAIWGDSQYHMHLVRPHADYFGLLHRHSRDGGLTWPDSYELFGLEIPLQVLVVPEPSTAAISIGAIALLAMRRLNCRQAYKATFP